MNIKVQKIEYRSLRNKEHLQFIRHIQEVLLNHNPDILNIRVLYDQLEGLAQEEETAMSVELGSVVTALRNEADSVRDRLHSALYHYVLSFTFDREEAAPFEAAQRVIRIIRQVGNPWKLADQAETSMLIQLGNELQPYRADLELIGAQPRLDRLLAANRRFAELDSQCRDDKNSRPSGNVKAVRTKINPVYLAIVSAINADTDRYRDGRYDAAANDLNAIIKDYSALLAQRRSGGKNGAPEE